VRYFFVFIMGWTMVASNVFSLYSLGITAQVFGHQFERVPRYFYTIVGSVVITLLAVFSRNSFASIISNLGSVLVYWAVIFFIIIVEEDIIFRNRGQLGKNKWFPFIKSIGYDLDAWDDQRRLPHGLAASAAFCIGAAGAVVAMGQTWYHGPIARAIAPSGGDLGFILAFSFSGISYPPLRYLELKKFHK
jgi:purine-cytosine permease-like protein